MSTRFSFLRAGLATCGAALLTLGALAPSASADTRVSTSDLATNHTVTITGIPDGHGAGLSLYRLGSFTSAQVNGSELTAFDIADNPNAKLPAFKGVSTNILREISKEASQTDVSNGYGVYASDLVEYLTGYALQKETGFAGTPVAIQGTQGTAEVPAGIYLLIDDTTTGLACMPALITTGVGGATTLDGSTLSQGACKTLEPPAPTKKVLDSDNHNSPTDAVSVSNADDVTYQVTVKRGYSILDARSGTNGDSHSPIDQAKYIPLLDTIPAGYTLKSLDSLTLNDADITARMQAVSSFLTGEAVAGGGAYFAATKKEGSGTPSPSTDPYGGTSDPLVFSLPASDSPSPEDTYVLTYTLKRTSDAITPEHAYSNSVTRLFSKNYTDSCTQGDDTDPRGSLYDTIMGSCATTTASSATVKTHKLEVKKQDVDGTSLDGAHFTLSREGQGVVFSSGTMNGYGTASDLTVNGTLALTGLDAGTYTLTETASPDGYMTVGLPSVTFTIDDNGTLTEKSGDTNALVDIADGVIAVSNAKSILQMPATGAAGIVRTLLIGAVLVGAGSAVIVTVRRRRHEQE